jgi:hypothetical protein
VPDAIHSFRTRLRAERHEFRSTYRREYRINDAKVQHNGHANRLQADDRQLQRRRQRQQAPGIDETPRTRVTVRLWPINVGSGINPNLLDRPQLVRHKSESGKRVARTLRRVGHE